jgi:ketosteroid isomerase-like protein
VSQENVEIVRRAFLASSSGDPASAREAYDPELEWDMSGVDGWAEKQVYRGDEVLPFLQAWANSWRDWHFDIDEVLPAPDERVFVAIHEWAAGVETGASVDQRRFFVADLREGLIARLRMFSDRTDALRAAGLEE